jgi:transcriptional regulator with XRE-family HTH domain
MIMERTGTGAGISGRQLARDVGIPSSTIDGLLSGATRTQPADVAQAIVDRLGVTLLVLWEPSTQAVIVDGRIPAASAAS